jgi:hypothetical protein
MPRKVACGKGAAILFIKDFGNIYKVDAQGGCLPGCCDARYALHRAAPIVSAIFAPRAPTGIAFPIVLSRAV